MFGSIFITYGGIDCLFPLFLYDTATALYTITYYHRFICSSNYRIFVMYIVRFLIAYVLFTPTADPSEDDSGLEENSTSVVDEKGKETATTNSTVEFQDESTEDIAQAVRTMMHREDEQQVNA